MPACCIELNHHHYVKSAPSRLPVFPGNAAQGLFLGRGQVILLPSSSLTPQIFMDIKYLLHLPLPPLLALFIYFLTSLDVKNILYFGV